MYSTARISPIRNSRHHYPSNWVCVQGPKNSYRTSRRIHPATFNVSTKLKELIEELAPGAAQILEVEQVPFANEVEKHTVLDKYWFCNVRRMIDCLDIVEDHNKPLSPNYKWCFTVGATFRPDRVPPDCHMFRDTKWYQSLYVSQHFKDEAKRRGIQGAVFQKAEDDLSMIVYANNSAYFRDFR